MNELALFAGAGGGILGGKLLGWRTVCAVEIEPYAASVLVARQNDRILPPFPIWDDVCTFDGHPWRGIVDVVSGGFPCQDISAAGKGAGITGERSGLWREMERVVREVDHDLYSWKTPQCSLFEDSTLFSGAWPRWGTMRNGECSERIMPGHLTKETEYGYWLIPTVMNATPSQDRRKKRTAYRQSIGRKDCPGSLSEQVLTPKFYPTPTRRDYKGCNSTEHLTKTTGHANHMNQLPNFIKMFLTPKATDTGMGEDSESFVKRNGDRSMDCFQSLPSQVGGQLNPTWVEWLMGWPLGWTDLKPLETGKSQLWLHSHGIH
jgi:hypothetical protein